MQEETYFDNYEKSASELSSSNFNLEYELSLSNRSLTDIAVKLGKGNGKAHESDEPESRNRKNSAGNTESPSLLSHTVALLNPYCVFSLNGCLC